MIDLFHIRCCASCTNVVCKKEVCACGLSYCDMEKCIETGYGKWSWNGETIEQEEHNELVQENAV